MGPGQSPVLNAPAPIGYAKGINQLIFGEFRTLPEVPPRKSALVWTVADYDADDQNSVAICLFGSMKNFTEYIQSAPPASTNHWSSSSAPSALGFLRSRGTLFDNYADTDDRMADVDSGGPSRGDQYLGRGEDAHHNSMGTCGAR